MQDLRKDGLVKNSQLDTLGAMLNLLVSQCSASSAASLNSGSPHRRSISPNLSAMSRSLVSVPALI